MVGHLHQVLIVDVEAADIVVVKLVLLALVQLVVLAYNRKVLWLVLLVFVLIDPLHNLGIGLWLLVD